VGRKTNQKITEGEIPKEFGKQFTPNKNAMPTMATPA
jgi:hypothetical protein